MTTKVQKIRNEVERLQNELIQEREKGFGSDVDDACILELQNVLTYIDSLQEEPVSEDLEEVSKNYALNNTPWDDCVDEMQESFKAGAKWQKEHLRTVGDRTMSKAEKFISEHIRNCSNELCAVEDRFGKKVISYHEWLTPDQARRAVEIAREEIINDFKERVTIFLEGAHEYTDNKKLQMQYDNEGLIRDFRAFVENIKQAMKDE